MHILGFTLRHFYSRVAAVVVLMFVSLAVIVPAVELGEPLPDTEKLISEGDLASQMVDGIDRFLLRQLDASRVERQRDWQPERSSPAEYTRSLSGHRQRLAKILGVVDPRIPYDAPQRWSTVAESAVLGRGDGYRIIAVRWPVVGTIHGEGLLLLPDDEPVADVVAYPDADQTPEQLVGLADGVPGESQYARRLAESGCRVVVPALVSRTLTKRRNATLTDREFLYRPAFELGRHLIGYEVQKGLAVADWFERDAPDRPMALFGWGEGGLLALYCGALDERFAAVGVSGYFNDRRGVWREPVDRNVFGLLERFGDAELTALVAPRALLVEAAIGPQVTIEPGNGGAPGQLETPELSVVRQEYERALSLVGEESLTRRFRLIESGRDGRGSYGTKEALRALLESVAPSAELATTGEPPTLAAGVDLDVAARQARIIEEIDRQNQRLLRESPYVRRAFFENLDASSLERFEATIEPYREHFAEEVIGQFDLALERPNPRSRKVYDEPKYEGYEVVLDVFPDVFAYGILLVPKNMAKGERRPVVVCQHGLEGRPQDVADPSVENPAYEQFACRLAEGGFVVFAPQNPYIFKDRFRTLQRKANPLKKTLFSVIVPQHEQITGWLAGLPFVDAERIAFYGLSYGGKTAMRVPALVPRYCLSICSADFNDWVWKNASTLAPYSYVWTGEYEIFEFDLGSTFNYAEMAALIAPRPFMVERGHFDGVAPDERVAYEYAKVRHLYAAQLGIGKRTEIEWFVGPHKINGEGTFAFLRKHLDWPQ